MLKSITKNAQRPRRKRLPPGYLVASEVAEITHSPPSSIYAAIKSGRLKASSWKGQIIVAAKEALDYSAVKPLRPVVADTADAKVNHD